MDYFQRALVAGLEAQRIRRIGEIFETWAVPPGVQVRREAVDRVAHVVGACSPANRRRSTSKMLVSSLKLQGIASTIFTTEWAASWFFNPAGVPQSQDMPIDATSRLPQLKVISSSVRQKSLK